MTLVTLAAALGGAVASPASAGPSSAPAAVTGALASGHSLTTTFESTNGSAGSAFDLEVKPATGVRIDSLDVNLNGTGIPVSVYTRPGPVGTSTNSLDGWTLRDTVAVTSRGYNQPTPVPITFHLAQGTWGVAVIHNSGRDASFGNSYRAGPVFADDALTLTTSGSWNSPAFASQYYTSYAWNGTLHYTDDVSATVDSGPSGRTREAGATFTYSADGPGASAVYEFACELSPPAPGGVPGPAPCADDGASYTDLTDGDYVFTVTATDTTGGGTSGPATQAFTVDTVAPETVVDTGPEGPTGSRDPAFTYRGTADDTDGFECALNPADPGEDTGFAACPTTGASFTALPDGTYTFAVRALDAAGNADATPATRDFTVDTGAPTLTATLSSDAAPKNGWYRRPVRIDYACTAAGSPLVTPCPPAVAFSFKDHTPTRSISDADGRTASVTSTVRIDRFAPRFALRRFDPARVYTTKPDVRCVATDTRSGVDLCATQVRLSDDRRRVVVTARAVDLAGNVRTGRRSAAYRPR